MTKNQTRFLAAALLLAGMSSAAWVQKSDSLTANGHTYTQMGTPNILDMTKPWLGEVGALFHKKTIKAVPVVFDTAPFLVYEQESVEQRG